MIENKIKVFYLRDEKRRPVGCVASVLQDGKIYFGVSTRNPEDTYDKDRGRNIAAGRIKNGRYVLPSGNIKEDILEIIAADWTMYPQRAREAAKNWLKINNAKA